MIYKWVFLYRYAEEAVKKLSAMTERVCILETENLGAMRLAGDVGEEVATLRLDRDLVGPGQGIQCRRLSQSAWKRPVTQPLSPIK